MLLKLLIIQFVIYYKQKLPLWVAKARGNAEILRQRIEKVLERRGRAMMKPELFSIATWFCLFSTVLSQACTSNSGLVGRSGTFTRTKDGLVGGITVLDDCSFSAQISIMAGVPAIYWYPFQMANTTHTQVGKQWRGRQNWLENQRGANFPGWSFQCHSHGSPQPWSFLELPCDAVRLVRSF